MADRLKALNRKASLMPNYSPKVDRISLPSPTVTRLQGHDLPIASPSVQRLYAMGMKQTLCSENVLKSATLAQLKLLQEDVVNWVARRQAEPLLRLKFDNVTKRVGVPAVGKHLPATSFRAALQLSSAHDDFIEFMGLRSESGEEVIFEESEDMPEPHLANWEERLHEDEVYVMLYLDSREELADQLTEAERQQILSEFDAIDSQMSGAVTTQDIQAYCDEKLSKELAAGKAEIDELKSRGDAGKKAAEEKERLLREKHRAETERLLATDIDDDGTVELHEFFRARTWHILSARGVAAPHRHRDLLSPRGDGKDAASKAAQPAAAAATTAPPQVNAPNPDTWFCPQCGKQFIGLFCTGCGTPKPSGDESSDEDEDRGRKGGSKKIVVKKKKKKGVSPAGRSIMKSSGGL